MPFESALYRSYICFLMWDILIILVFSVVVFLFYITWKTRMVSGLFLVACFWWLYLGGFFRVKFMSFRASYTYGGFTSKVSQLLVLIWQSFFVIVPILPLIPIMHILLVSCFIMLRGLICPIIWNWTLPTPTPSSDNILYPFWKWVNWALNCWMVLGFRMVSSDLWFSDQDYIF